MNFRPVDAKYSSALDRLVLVSAAPDTLHIYNAATNNDQTVNLSAPPTNVAISPDGLHAAVAHPNAVSYVNLQTATVENVFTADVGTGIVALSQTYIYVLPSYESNPISIEIATGIATTAQTFAYSSGGTYDSTTSEVYDAQNGISPNTLNVFTANSILGNQNRGPYFDLFPVCGPFWLSPDGSKIYTACGTIFKASTDATQDMRYVTSLYGMQQLVSLTDSGSQVAAIPATLSTTSNPTPLDNQVNLFDSADYNPFGTLLLPPFVSNGSPYTAHGRNVFFNQAGNTIYVLAQADPTSGLLHDFAIDSFSLNGGACSAQFSTTTAPVAGAGTYMQATISNPGGCPYTSTSNAAWITLTSNILSNGAPLGYLVRPNFTGSERTGTITAGTSTLTVTQGR